MGKGGNIAIKVGGFVGWGRARRRFWLTARLSEEEEERQGYELKSGVYFASTGPTYETPAEYKYYRLIGADAVGMSTIPEVIVARHSSIPVFGVSVITNEAHDDYADDYVNDGDDVVVAANAAADKMTAIFTKVIESL